MPLLVLSLLGLFGFVALSIDLGLIAIARTQIQNAADAAATTGARTLNGEADNNYDEVDDNAIGAAQANSILGKPIVAATQLTLDIGSYHYNDAAGKFEPNYTGKAPEDNWSLVRAWVTANPDYAFARVFNLTTFNVSAMATAVHRPRDIAVILDFSGSMRFDSLLGIPYTGPRTMSNNPETVYPRFGPYSATATAALENPNPSTIISGDDNVYGSANITVETASGPPIVNDFYQHVLGATAQLAFASAGDGDSDGWVVGDKFLKENQNTGANYAKNANEILNFGISPTQRNPDWELDGYAKFTIGTDTDYTNVPFHGYTQGPRYWGKTFVLWPPDPRWPLGSGTEDRRIVKQFLRDCGYTNGQITDSPTGSGNAQVLQIWQNWPWPDEATLISHLESTPSPSGVGTLTSTETAYQRILRLHHRPRGDWRRRFFLKTDQVTPVDANDLLWNSSGVWRTPPGNYYINYAEVLKWLDTSPKPFPPRLRSGRIVYYDAFPNYNDATLNNRFWTEFPLTNLNERFWKEYIDYVLGLWQRTASTWQNITQYTGYGDDYTWGTPQINAKPTQDASTSGHTITPTTSGNNRYRYMVYGDQPLRPRLHFWFGPMTMIDFLGNYNQALRTTFSSTFVSDVSNPPPYYGMNWWWPGTCHEAPLWSCKIGMKAALKDIERNHPNDFVAVLKFATPRPERGGRFNRARVPLSRNYPRMQDILWFPISTIDNPGTEARLYGNTATASPALEADNTLEAPRAMGGTGATLGFALAYNQFSSNPDLRTYAPPPAPAGEAGGNGRKGAQKVIIFETDGVANVVFNTNVLENLGAYNSYYRIRQPGELPGGVQSNSVENHSVLLGVVDQICALETASPPGYSTTRKPVLIHCIGFGTLFNADSTDPDKPYALQLLQDIQFRGKTQASAADPLPSYKIVTGTPQQRIDKLRDAIGRIMQDGIQVSLIE
jgi:Flp pilus assembly protein TadG